MNHVIELLTRSLIIGIGGSALIDLWSLALRRLFGVSTLNYAWLGRWILHMPKRRFVHQRIATSQPVRGERPLGWLAHYSIGVGFAFLLLVTAGSGWADSPTVLPPMVFGVATVAAPWFVMQPAFGAGIAGSKTPQPWAGRLRNLGTHSVFGAGMFISAWLIAI